MPPTSRLYEPSLCISIRGTKRMIVGDRNLIHEEDGFLLFSAGMPAIVEITTASEKHPHSALLIDLDLDLARQIMAEIDMNGTDTQQPSETCLAYGRVDDDLFDAILRLVRLLERPREVPIMRALIQREVLFRLLIGPSGNRLRQIVRIGSPSQRIARAIAWLRGHFTERLSIDELAEHAGMGISTLHRRFQEVTTMSPLQYQKQLRLAEARRLMLAEGIEVGTAAYAVGYESTTQFNREYRRRFGAPPLRDVNALRRTAQAAVL